MAKPDGEVVFAAQDGVTVAALWYGKPHSCWRTEIRADEPLDNMTYGEALKLWHALLRALEAQRPTNHTK